MRHASAARPVRATSDAPPVRHARVPSDTPRHAGAAWTSARWTAVSPTGSPAQPLRREANAQISARVAALLAAADTFASGRAALPAPAPGVGPAESATTRLPVLAHLARAVERIERRGAVRAMERRPPRAEQDATEPRRAPAPFEGFATAARAVHAPGNIRESVGEAPLATGLRGLAARADGAVARPVRAPLLTRPNASLDDWPDGDDERFGRALDDAARRAGVDPGEVGW